jgi:hypothetical protein
VLTHRAVITAEAAEVQRFVVTVLPHVAFPLDGREKLSRRPANSKVLDTMKRSAIGAFVLTGLIKRAIDPSMLVWCGRRPRAAGFLLPCRGREFADNRCIMAQTPQANGRMIS